MEKKICSKCQEEKEVCEFYTDKTKIDGYYSSCKDCKNTYSKTRVNETKTYLKLWRIKNPNYNKEFLEKNPNYVKEYYQKNKNKMIDSVKKHFEKNKDKLREKIKIKSLEYYYKNKNKVIEKNKKYREINKEKIKEKRKEYNKKYLTIRNERIKQDPILNLIKICRSRIAKFLRTNKITKRNKTFEIIGCNPTQLKEYLEQKFTEGMSWDLMGKHIHIDHIIPLSSAKTEEEIYKLCHYTNLQPLWAEDNLKKSNKIL